MTGEGQGFGGNRDQSGWMLAFWVHEEGFAVWSLGFGKRVGEIS